MRSRTAPLHGPTRQRGYALMLMLVLLTMGLLFGVVSRLSKVGSEAERAMSTQSALKQAREALIAYAITYRDTHGNEPFGYLPCPDTDGDGYAQSVCASQDVSVVGLLPYRTLGLMEPRDAEGNCLWYAVSGNYKNNPKTAILNWDTRGKYKLLDQDGSTVLTDPSLAGDAYGGGAAVIFAPGAPLSGQSGRTAAAGSACGITSVTGWNNYLESAAFDASGQSSADPLNITDGKPVNPLETVASANNDQIAWVSAKDIWTRVRERSDRGSLNDLNAAMKTLLENSLVSDLAATQTPATLPPQSATTYTTPSNAYAGKVGELPDIQASLAGNLQNYFGNWKEQYRYVACSDLCGYCLNIGGQQCDGALFFSGAAASGAPRAAGARGIADLFEDGDGKPLLLATSNAFNGASSYGGGSADTGICLASKTDTLATAVAHCVLPDAVGTPGFTGEVSSGADAIALDTVNHTITLGASSSANTSACVWTNNTYVFGSGLRVYFQVNIVDFASGATFAVIDADQQSSATPCGGDSYYLGYAGNSGNPIRPPKLGLELDTIASPAFFGRNDPLYQHMALVYWGLGSTYGDDNSHAVSGDSGFPSNPTTPGVSSNLSGLFGGGLFHVRMDISRTGCNGSTCNYMIGVWTLPNSGATPGDISALSNVSVAYGGSLSQTVGDSFTMNQNFGGVPALQNIRLGFTVGQAGSSGAQEIVISNLLAYFPP